ncbi:MAG: hypothetical protein ACM3NI_11670 [Bacteroidota bacterium]
MSVTHGTSVRDLLATVVVDQLDAGTLQFQTAAGAEVATLNFNTPAFAAPVNGEASANVIAGDPDAVGGVIAIARAFNNSGVMIWMCPVTAAGGGGSIELGGGVTVSPHQAVEMTSLLYRAAP